MCRFSKNKTVERSLVTGWLSGEQRASQIVFSSLFPRQTDDDSHMNLPPHVRAHTNAALMKRPGGGGTE